MKMMTDFYNAAHKAINPNYKPASATAVKPITDPLQKLKAMLGNGAALSPELLGAEMPDYQSMLVQKGGKKMVDDPYRIDPGQIDNIYKAQSKQIDVGAKKNLDDLATQTSQGIDTATSNLAQGGGFDAGSAARLAQTGLANRITAGQDIYGGAAMAKAGAAAQAAQGKVAATQFNANTAIGDNANLNNYAFSGWGKLGDIYGSGQIADAMAAQANKEDPGLLGQGGILGTGLGGSKGLLGSGVGTNHGILSGGWLGTPVNNLVGSVGFGSGAGHTLSPSSYF